MALQGVTHFKEIRYSDDVLYGEIVGQAEREMSVYYLDDADIAVTRELFTTYEAEARRLIAERLARRLSPGSTWVSHLLQRLVLALVSDDTVLAGVERAARHYRARNDRFAAELTRLGLPTAAGDGLSVWVRVPAPARAVAEQLMRRGWLARPGDEFVLADPEATHRLRLTVHDLSDTDLARLAADVAASARAIAPSPEASTAP